MGRLAGEIAVPGDKSISHRALILAALARGQTGITGLGPGADIRSTRDCLRRMGVRVDSHEVRRQSLVVVEGVGLKGLRPPSTELDCGNSGTTMRLLMGVVAGHELEARFVGDESLSRRPMGRVAKPLVEMGAVIELSGGDRAPLKVRGGSLKGIHYALPVASAQLKSAVLLAGLMAEGTTSVAEPVLSRDHTERMLAHFGAPPLRVGLKVSVEGKAKLQAVPVRVPGDPSSAAFWAVAATVLAGSDIKLVEVGLNPTRTGFLNVLGRMGAKIERELWPSSVIGTAEPVGDLVVRAAPLTATEIMPEEVPGLIDEIPILALAASQAEGSSRFRGLGELRHKESDRLSRVAELLELLGAAARVEGDDLIVEGPRALKGAKIFCSGDHRLAMTAMVAGLIAEGTVAIEDADCAKVSYPTFYEDLSSACV